MAFTMHSHSGQFCDHAQDTLEAVVQRAVAVGFTTMGLTEHMPRTAVSDLYPEELSGGGGGDDGPPAKLASLASRFAAYLIEARRLQERHADRIRLLIGFETEWIRATEYAPLVLALAADPSIDYFVGSVHHTLGVPIDFDPPTYARAVAAAGGSEEALWERYYDEQLDMLTALRPRVVGHFDLVRLLSGDPARDVRLQWSGVWARVRRNLAAVRAYGGWLECNTSALRKGLAEPYPARPIAEEWRRLGGRWTVSDDSHGVAQVATNYARGADYLRSLGVAEVWTLERTPAVGLGASLTEKKVSLSDFMASLKLD